MKAPRIGVLHPGAMGASVGAAAKAAGADVCWASADRSAATRDRAEAAGLTDAGTVQAVLDRSEIVFSVCPPHGALDLARAVAACGYAGVYVDANAVAPGTAREIASVCAAANMPFVDGGIIGPPVQAAGSTRLYLSGDRAREVAGLFADSVLEAIPIDGPPGAASALKMCYAAYTKGSAALVMGIRALATHEGVEPALLEEWGRSQPNVAERYEVLGMAAAPKAWRFVGEMQEIADSFAAAGLPDGFHRAAADLYARLESYKDVPDLPPYADVLTALLQNRESS